MASLNCHLEVAQFLVEKGADINVRDDVGNTALSIAEEGDHSEIVNYLQEKTDERRRD